MELFRVKKSVIHDNQWQELKDITSQGKYDTSPTGVIKESFYSSLQRSGEDGSNGSLKRRNVMACQY